MRESRSTESSRSRPPLNETLPVLGGLVLVALALRPQVIAIGPLLPAIRADLDVSHGVAGLLATIPVLCMGIFAPLGPRLAGRLGPRLAIAGAIGAIIVFGLLRAVAPGALPVILLTFGVGLGMGLAGPILSIVVRIRTPHLPALGTGAFAFGIVLGSAITAAVAVPLANGDNWRFALAIFSIVGVVSLAAWLLLVAPDAGDHVRERPPRLPWRSATGWTLAIAFGLQSILYYGVVSWLPNVYVERGWTQEDAASLVAILHMVGLVTTIGVPLISDRAGSRRRQILAAALGALVSLAGVILVPEAGIAWACILGLSLGAVFPLVLTLPVDVADSPADVGAVAALMLLVGYVLSSVGPVLLGLARDVTGDFEASLWLLVGLAAALIAASALLSPTRIRRGIDSTRPASGS